MMSSLFFRSSRLCRYPPNGTTRFQQVGGLPDFRSSFPVQNNGFDLVRERALKRLPNFGRILPFYS